MRSEDIREHLETGCIIEEIRKHKRNSKEHAESMTSELLSLKEYCYSITGKRDRPPRKS
jgi:hypothetical protein